MMCNYIYSDLHSFVANGPCNYCIELWLTLGVSLIKLSWKFLMLVLGMNCFDWIVKKGEKKSISTFGMYFSYFGSFWVWDVTYFHAKKLQTTEIFISWWPRNTCPNPMHRVNATNRFSLPDITKFLASNKYQNPYKKVGQKPRK